MQAESLIYQTEKQLKEFESKVCAWAVACDHTACSEYHGQQLHAQFEVPDMHLIALFCVQIPADVKAGIDGKVKALRDAVASDSLESMKAGIEALQQEVSKATGSRVNLRPLCKMLLF